MSPHWGQYSCATVTKSFLFAVIKLKKKCKATKFFFSPRKNARVLQSPCLAYKEIVTKSY